MCVVYFAISLEKSKRRNTVFHSIRYSEPNLSKTCRKI